MKYSSKRIELDRSKLLGFRKTKPVVAGDKSALKRLHSAMVGGKPGIKVAAPTRIG